MPLNGEQTVMHNDNNALPVEIMSSLCHLKYNLSVSLLSPICSIIGYECEHSFFYIYCLIPFLLTSQAVSKRKALERITSLKDYRETLINSPRSCTILMH